MLNLCSCGFHGNQYYNNLSIKKSLCLSQLKFAATTVSSLSIPFLKTFSASVLSSRFFLTSPSNAIDAMMTISKKMTAATLFLLFLQLAILRGAPVIRDRKLRLGTNLKPKPSLHSSTQDLHLSVLWSTGSAHSVQPEVTIELYCHFR